jgi:3-oxoacyl-[acyl-carrier protein] reductase
VEVEGKAAIVTGGGTGVGRATALELARRGCSVLVSYSRSKDEAEQTAAEIRDLGVKGVAFQGDVADDAACRAYVETALREFGRLDVLVNNAGATVFVPHAELDRLEAEDWHRIFDVNVLGAFQCARAAKAALDASGSGEIVNISSVAGVAGTGSSLPYCASKAALNNLTVTLARVMAPATRVNAIAPGFITGRWLGSGLGDSYEPAKAFMESRAPLGRVCDPEDVRDAILSVITGSDLVTGQIIVVDGGTILGT